jgi:hypothetical protein
VTAPTPWEMAATAGEEPPAAQLPDEGVPLAAGEVGAAVSGEGEVEFGGVEGDSRLRKAVAEARDRKGEVSITLHGVEGGGVLVEDLAKALQGWHRLMQTVSKDVALGEPLEWRIVSAAAIDDAVKVAMEAHPRRPRPRKKRA